MDIKTYLEDAERTSAKLDHRNHDMVHYVQGLTSEIGEITDIFKRELAYKKEIDRDHLIEELGDAFWYVAMIQNNFKLIADFNDDNLKQILDETRELVEDLKITKENFKLIPTILLLAYDSTDAKKLYFNYTASAIKYLLIVVEVFEIDLLEVFQINIDKLKVRYPEKFTEEKAVNRDLNEEKKVINKENG